MPNEQKESIEKKRKENNKPNIVKLVFRRNF